jgi:hypothetical protein
MDHQLRKQHQLGPLRRRPLAPGIDVAKHSIGFTQETIHAHGRRSDCFHALTSLLPMRSAECGIRNKIHITLSRNGESIRWELFRIPNSESAFEEEGLSRCRCYSP